MGVQIESIRPIYSLPTDCVGNGQSKENLPNHSGEKTPEQKMLEAFRNEKAKSFVQDNLLKKYRDFFPDHAQEAEDMVINAFSLVSIMAHTKNQKKNGALKNALTTIHDLIIVDNDWFPRAYGSYRKQRAEKDYSQIQPHMKGKEVLDFGCGLGYLDLVLKQNGFRVTSADVIDYENRVSKEDAQIEFKKMNSQTDVTYPYKHFDTIILWQVLHHINEEDLFPILNGLSKIGDRFVIKDDVYGSGEGINGFSQSISEQKELVKYMELTEKDQIDILIIVDNIANIVLGSSLDEMNMPLRFKPIDQWKAIFTKAGFDIVDISFTGIEKHKLHPDPQILIIAESRKNKS